MYYGFISIFKRFLVWIVLGFLTLGQSVATHAVGFTDVTVDAGVDYVQQSTEPQFLFEQPFMTGGAAAGDFDGDGWVDLYVTRFDASDLLFQNQGDGTFTEVSSLAGLTQNRPTNGAAWGDIDNDGDLDLYVTAIFTGRFFLYQNDGKGHFTEVGLNRNAALDSGDTHYGFSVTFGDYDRDGWLDIHTTEWAQHGFVGFNHSRLLHNRGEAMPGHFTDVTVDAGVAIGSLGSVRAFTSSFSDFDEDGWPDLAISADYGTSQLFWNNRDGTFINGTEAAGLGTDENGMGSAIGDYDGDGHLDWFVTSIYQIPDDCAECPWGFSGNRLYRNLGNRQFTDQTDAAGVRNGDWGWGSLFFDYDNDGDLDLVMTNGIDFSLLNDLAKPYESDRMRLWRNEGGIFTEVGLELGITDTGQGKGLLTFDYDQDGDLDLFVVNTAGHPVLYRNDLGSGNHWLRVSTLGRWSNRDGIGCRLSLQALPDGPIQVREIRAGNHFLGQSEYTAHFGLKEQTETVHELTIQWPSGTVQVLKNVEINQTLVAIEPLTYLAWQLREFEANDLNDPTVSGRTADPDRDNVPNQLEYAFGREPLVFESKPLISPHITKDPGDQLHYLTMTFTRMISPTDLDYMVEVSSDLYHWQSGPSFTEEMDVIGSGNRLTQHGIVKILPPIQNANQLFARIKVIMRD
ncbi:MAG TPA: CRTAC1 family protein [Verrucomicrobiales bacterium]|nr:CRTAC1 family protein [Verrucomicrobiales bacterium]HIL70353.1 CRTAC1 family protein [Verrucomicrobiota bacterium]